LNQRANSTNTQYQKNMSQSKTYYVYILTNQRNGTLYIGFSSNLNERMNQHINGTYDGFTKKYKIHNLVYYETYDDVNIAIKREKQLKKWNRKWKIRLIEETNPDWRNLNSELFVL